MIVVTRKGEIFSAHLFASGCCCGFGFVFVVVDLMSVGSWLSCVCVASISSRISAQLPSQFPHESQLRT
jgi:hypothetical protein